MDDLNVLLAQTEHYLTLNFEITIWIFRCLEMSDALSWIYPRTYCTPIWRNAYKCYEFYN